ncbi:MAG: ornithine carbamoyltransferase [Desulfobacterales bacterium]
MKKDIRTLLDLTKADIDALLAQSIDMKALAKKGVPNDLLKGKTLGMVFNKASTRTRISFETAMIQLGGSPIFVSEQDTQIARDEPVSDTARVLSRYLDGLAIRTYSQDLLETFAEYASIPVINALTDLYHPCQILSDLMTIVEYKGGYEGLKIAWIGDGNNVANSWINAASIIGLDLVLACPDAYRPAGAIVDPAVGADCGTITLTDDPAEAVAGADVIYTDVWASMGQEHEHRLRKRAFESFMVNEQLVAKATKEVIVMHCLPAHRGEEISEAVLEGPASVVWDQAENKRHMTKAILAMLMGGIT